MEDRRRRHTLQLLQHAVDGARAAAAGHADVEDVFVLGAGVGGGLDRAGGGIDDVGHCVWLLGWCSGGGLCGLGSLLLSKQVLGAVWQRCSWRWWSACWFLEEEGSRRFLERMHLGSYIWSGQKIAAGLPFEGGSVGWGAGVLGVGVAQGASVTDWSCPTSSGGGGGGALLALFQGMTEAGDCTIVPEPPSRRCENCANGAMERDGGMLINYDFQSRQSRTWQSVFCVLLCPVLYCSVPPECVAWCSLCGLCLPPSPHQKKT